MDQTRKYLRHPLMEILDHGGEPLNLVIHRCPFALKLCTECVHFVLESDDVFIDDAPLWEDVTLSQVIESKSSFPLRIL